jgi:hypothetical protein
VYLGACVELAERDGHQRWAERAAAILDAIAARIAGPDGLTNTAAAGRRRRSLSTAHLSTLRSFGSRSK